jgi:hypothetical protein
MGNWYDAGVPPKRDESEWYDFLLTLYIKHSEHVDRIAEAFEWTELGEVFDIAIFDPLTIRFTKLMIDNIDWYKKNMWQNKVLWARSDPMTEQAKTVGDLYWLMALGVDLYIDESEDPTLFTTKQLDTLRQFMMERTGKPWEFESIEWLKEKKE